MRFNEKSLFLGVDSLRVFEYLGHFRIDAKAMVDVATYVAVDQDIRVALGLAENMVVANFFSYDADDDYERVIMKRYWPMPRLQKQFYMTRACHEFLADPYLTERSRNLKGPGWSVDGWFDSQPLPTFEKIEIDRPFNVTNARWLQGTIRTNSYMKGRIAPGLIQPAKQEDDEDRRHRHWDYQLHRVSVVVDDPASKPSWYADEPSEDDDIDGPGEVADTSRYDGAALFAISYEGDYYREGCLIEVGRSFTSDGSTWRLSVELACKSVVGEFDASDHTLLQSTLCAVIGADLVRLAYLAGESEHQPAIECDIRFVDGSIGGLMESMRGLSKADGFWDPIPRRLRHMIQVNVA